MESQAADRRSGVLFMYAASLDAWLHDHTRQHSGLESELLAIRARIERVIAAARANHDEVFWHMFSDHGMCTVDRHVQVLPILERTGLRMHVDYQCVVDSTMVRLWYSNSGHRTLLREALSACGEIRLLDSAWLAKEHCAFPDDRFGQDIWLANPGVLLVPSHMGSTPLAAMHGYDPDHSDTDASYLTNVPNSQPSDIVGINTLIHQAITEVARVTGAKA
jgi:predicted AlkP superfamily pyrophosphatase or phosphodiesterase